MSDYLFFGKPKKVTITQWGVGSKLPIEEADFGVVQNMGFAGKRFNISFAKFDPKLLGIIHDNSVDFYSTRMDLEFDDGRIYIEKPKLEDFSVKFPVDNFLIINASFSYESVGTYEIEVGAE